MNKRAALALVLLLVGLAYIVYMGIDPGFTRACPLGAFAWQACRIVYIASVPILLMLFGGAIALLVTRRAHKR